MAGARKAAWVQQAAGSPDRLAWGRLAARAVAGMDDRGVGVLTGMTMALWTCAGLQDVLQVDAMMGHRCD